VQHYQVATESLDYYRLKNTKRNTTSKGSAKYTTTTHTSAIVKCQGCNLHDAQHLLEASKRAHHNFRDSPTCLFRQSDNVAHLLPIKSHQIYQDIVLLQHHLSDLLPQYDPLTNNVPSSTQPVPGTAPDNIDIDRPRHSPSISYPNIDIVAVMIDQFIDSPVLSHKLKHIAITLNQDRNIQFYTDGSLQSASSNIASMGLAWIVLNHDSLEFSASAVLWPSSTKAETLACFTALLVVPLHAHVVIHTDSTATIAGFDHLPSLNNMSICKREKICNFQIWMTIAHLIEAKHIKISMIKVKAHSGNPFNDRADQLAKAAALSSPRLHIQYLRLPGLNVEITCDFLTLEMSSRRCIKSIFEAKQFFQLLQLQRHSDLYTLTEQHHISWASTSFMLNYNKSDKDKATTSFKQHRQRTFKYKLFTDELPTLYRLKIRRPDLYPTDVCLSCQQETEIQTHFWTCLSYQAQWRNIIDRAADKLHSFFLQRSSKQVPPLEVIQRRLHESRTFISKGIVSAALYDFVHQVCRASSDTNLTIAQTLNFIYQQVFSLIWKPRCVKVIAYEQTLGLNNRNK